MRKVICTVAASKQTDVKADTSIRDRISYLQDREVDLKEKLADPYLDEDERIDLGMELAEIQEQLNFAWQDDEAEYDYALQQQEFNPDGSLKGYDDVYGAEEKPMVSQCSFDFVNDGKYDYKHMEDIIFEAFKDAGVTPLAADFRSVDYSTYPGYSDKIVSQCGVDFEWSGKYYEDAIEEEVASVLDLEGYELIGMSFESADESMD